MISALRRSGMIAAVALPLLYLIFVRAFGVVWLLGRRALSKDVEPAGEPVAL